MTVAIKSMLVFSVLAFGQGSAFAHADDEHDQFSERMDRQTTRIDNGLDSGALTHREHRQLTKQQRAVAKLRSRFLRDGYYSQKERRILKQKLKRLSRSIYQLKHNRVVAYQPSFDTDEYDDDAYVVPTYRSIRHNDDVTYRYEYPNGRTSYTETYDAKSGFLKGTGVSSWW